MRSAATVLCLLASLALMGAKEKDSATRVSVSIQNLKFDPAAVTIHPGDIVVWTNNDDRDYSIDAKDGSFSSGNLRNGQSYEHKYMKAGPHPYGCQYHPRMKGMVTVVDDKGK